MTYFIVQNGQQQGPFNLDQLRTKGINANTPVWTQGFPNWKKAFEIPELQELLIPTPPTDGLPDSPPPYQQAPQHAAMRQQYGHQQQQYAAQQQYGNWQPGAQPPPMPDTWLAWAICATILCCLPFGIVAIVYASKVSSKYQQGLYEEAEQASKNAKTWTIVSVVTSLVFFLIYILLLIAHIITLEDLRSF